MAASGDRLSERYKRFANMFVRLVDGIVLRFGDDLLGLAKIESREYSAVGDHYRVPEKTTSNKCSIVGAAVGAVLLTPDVGSHLGKVVDKYLNARHQAKWVDAIHANLCLAAAQTVNLRGVLVKTAAAIFRAYEMQFATLESGTDDHLVMYALAVEAVDRILDHCIEEHIGEVNVDELTRAFVLGKRKGGSSAKITLRGKRCEVCELYDKVRLLKRDGVPETYFKKENTGVREAAEFGYRLTFEREDPKESGYRMFDPTISTIYNGYSYVLGDADLEDELMSRVLGAVNKNDVGVKLDEMMEVLTAMSGKGGGVKPEERSENGNEVAVKLEEILEVLTVMNGKGGGVQPGERSKDGKEVTVKLEEMLEMLTAIKGKEDCFKNEVKAGMDEIREVLDGYREGRLERPVTVDVSNNNRWLFRADGVRGSELVEAPARSEETQGVDDGTAGWLAVRSERGKGRKTTAECLMTKLGQSKRGFAARLEKSGGRKTTAECLMTKYHKSKMVLGAKYS